jgi:cytosine deaminase
MSSGFPRSAFRLQDASVPEGTYELTDVQAAAALRCDADGVARLDIDVAADGTIVAVTPAGTSPLAESMAPVALAGRQVWPGFVDAHAHIDKAHTWPRAPNPDGTLSGAREAAKRDRIATWRYEEVYRRMDFAVRTARHHGTWAIRTHLDSQEGRTEPSWTAFLALRDAWAGRVVLQGTLTLGIAKLAGRWGERVADWAAENGLNLGPVAYDGPNLADELARAFDLASDRGIDLDFHVDETDDESADGLTRIAETALVRRFSGKILCSHACSLSRRPAAAAHETIAKLRAAGIGIVSLPMTNLYLQDRQRLATPRWRGITLLRELHTAGVPVALAGDNVRDAFHPYGDHDLLDVFRDAVRLGHLDLPIGDWPCAVTRIPAELLGLASGPPIAAGRPADMVIFQGRDYTEVLARHGRDRVILRAGRQIDEPLPDYRELDDPV